MHSGRYIQYTWIWAAVYETDEIRWCKPPTEKIFQKFIKVKTTVYSEHFYGRWQAAPRCITIWCCTNVCILYTHIHPRVNTTMIHTQLCTHTCTLVHPPHTHRFIYSTLSDSIWHDWKDAKEKELPRNDLAKDQLDNTRLCSDLLILWPPGSKRWGSAQCRTGVNQTLPPDSTCLNTQLLS